MSQQQVEYFDAALERLRARRRSEVKREQQADSRKIVWKVQLLQQAFLYRVVMLADGAKNSWDAKNPLAAVLCARALLETLAVFLGFKKQFVDRVTRGDFNAVNELLRHHTFATRLEGRLAKGPELKSKNVLNFIDDIDQKYGNVRLYYDYLSDTCHPNSLGHYEMFADATGMDLVSFVVQFSEAHGLSNSTFNPVIRAYQTVDLVENALDEIDALLPELVKLSDAAQRTEAIERP